MRLGVRYTPFSVCGFVANGCVVPVMALLFKFV